MSAHVHWVPELGGAEVGSLVEVTGDEAHHAVAVRRLRVGEEVVLTDGRGTSLTGTVDEVAKRRFTVRVDAHRFLARPGPEFTVVQAVPKGERGELAVEMLTELGVDTIVPWAAQRCVALWRGERAEKSRNKWAATAREAAKQARRSWFPDVTPIASTDEVLALVADAAQVFVLHEEATMPLAGLVPDATGPIVLVVGPEGGVSPEEVEAFARAGAPAVRLGPEVLRTSTAGVAAMSALLAGSARWH
ncbi:16S rRNA (uracil(1498)-N(3))-methyltransferase [Nocardioides alcanivorans]|uniref:16S rRNA (uracil(1498)-N(3))-methyltransferase n=1 Tax=Nocardioides alcanivorans TaxID=2897352 RepID=UPI001F3AA110|nr:16S rRNA (uracil(1498)-N(3))-methyltransferase [Nocardioides alcanivorans]